MSRKLSSAPLLSKYQPFIKSTTAIINASHETVITSRPSKIQRWIFGMIIGSAPFLIIILSWMFVSVCLNNFVRLYHYRKHRCRQNARTNGFETIPSKINI